MDVLGAEPAAGPGRSGLQSSPLLWLHEHRHCEQPLSVTPCRSLEGWLWVSPLPSPPGPPLPGLPSAWVVSVYPGLSLLELSARLSGKCSSLETTQKAERSRPHPDVPTPGTQCWLRAIGWREEPPGGGSSGGRVGWDRGPQFALVSTRSSLWLLPGTGERVAHEMLGKKQGDFCSSLRVCSLPVITETRLQKQISSFFNQFFSPMVTHFCS